MIDDTVCIYHMPAVMPPFFNCTSIAQQEEVTAKHRIVASFPVTVKAPGDQVKSKNCIGKLGPQVPLQGSKHSVKIGLSAQSAILTLSRCAHDCM
jgi:hypothetical protein